MPLVSRSIVPYPFNLLLLLSCSLLPHAFAPQPLIPNPTAFFQTSLDHLHGVRLGVLVGQIKPDQD